MLVVANEAGLDKLLHMQQLRQQILCASLKHGKKSTVLNDVAQLEPSDTVTYTMLMTGLYEPNFLTRQHEHQGSHGAMTMSQVHMKMRNAEQGHRGRGTTLTAWFTQMAAARTTPT